MNKTLILILWLIAFCFSGFGQETVQNPARLSLIAADKSNVFVDDLKKEEMALFVNGKPKTIASFEKQELPLIYGLAIDSTGSMRLMFKDILGAAQSIVNQNRAEDETMLVSFISADQIKATKSFSADKNILIKTINEFTVEGGATALIDAIYLTVQQVAAHKKDEAKNYCRAVIVITDGEDRDSFYTEKALFDLIAKENVRIFFIGLTDNLESEGGIVERSVKDKSLRFMKKVAQVSGGAILSQTKKKMKESAAAILPLVRTQYVLGYPPTVAGKDTSPKIEIKPAKDSKRKGVEFYFRQED